LFIYGNGTESPLRRIDEVLYTQGTNPTTRKYYVHDHLYSPVAALYLNGTVSERYEYDAYGNCSILEPNFAPDPDGKSDYGNNYLFTGRRIDILDNSSLKIQYNRNRYYDYYTGRWLTQDPLGITPNAQKPNKFTIIRQYTNNLSLYEYVRSNPVNRFDPSGLFYGSTHDWLTRKALLAIVETLPRRPSEKITFLCKDLLRRILPQANLRQDRGESSDKLERHYTRPKKKQETDADKRKADKDYEIYLFKEWRNFGDELSKKPPDCEAALQALGRMDHSLQDFYGHAIRRDDGFEAWNDGVTGDPGNRDNFWPPSYPGEHPKRREPLNRGEWKKRRDAALSFMKEHYESYLGKWWDVCHCWCNCRGK